MSNWFVVTAGLLAVAVLVAARLRTKRQGLGAVSDQWIAQHRAGETLDAF